MPWKTSELMDQRREFALKALGAPNFRELCREYGISTKTGYKWRERLLRQGLEGMAEDSRRPGSSPKQLAGGEGGGTGDAEENNPMRCGRLISRAGGALERLGGVNP